jgi:membrane protease YdiL (CAAX protease family)
MARHLGDMIDSRSKSGIAVSTRDLVFAFLLAKGAAVLIALWIGHDHEEYESLALVAASVVAVVVFMALLLQAGKCSLTHLLRTTRPARPSWTASTTMIWILLAVAMGFLLRFGNGGLVLGAFEVIDPSSVSTEIADVLSSLVDPAYGLTWMLVLEMAMGSIQEELIYRQILQSQLCRRYGVAIGILTVSGIFCAMHYANPTTLVAGGFFSLLYVYAGRLWVPIIAHSSANLTLPVLASLGIPATAHGLSLAMYVSAVVLCAVATILLVAICRRAVAPYEYRQAAQ